MQYAVICPLFYEVNLLPSINGIYFILIVIASVTIAAAGNYALKHMVPEVQKDN